MTDRLSQVLSPIGLVPFFERYWAKEHLHVSRSSSGYYDGILSAGDLDRLFESEQLPASFFHVIKNGVTHHPEEWSRLATAKMGEQRVALPERLFDLYSNGATLILNQAHHAIPALGLACREIACELGFPSRANIYAAPPEAEGFSRHTDPHEILILQISGTKSWLLYPPSGPVEIELRAGDLLYLPRNLAHAARTHKDASIHVSLGLVPVYGFRLLEDLAAMAQDHPGFQQPVPPKFAGREARRLFEAEFARNLRDLVMEATLSDQLIERRFLSLVEMQSKGWTGRFTDLLRLEKMTADTVVCARAGIVRAIEDDGKFLNVSFAGNQIRVPKFLKSCLDRILGDTPFAIREMQGMASDPDRLELARKFVRTGFLAIVRI
jgi:lysine-specific demethylase/histidyl-hydroxylase NO66